MSGRSWLSSHVSSFDWLLHIVVVVGGTRLASVVCVCRISKHISKHIRSWLA